MLIGVVLHKKSTRFNPTAVSLCQILFVIICIVLGDVHIVPADTFFIIFSIVSGLSDLCIHG